MSIEIKEKSRFEGDLYSRGFAIFPAGSAKAPPHFRALQIGSWVLATHAATAVVYTKRQSQSSFVALIGYAMDLDGRHDDGQRISSDLLNCLERSEREFFEKVSGLAGRYVIFYSFHGLASVIGDACATKATFYANDRPVIGSHFQMVAEMAGMGPSSQKLRRNKDKARHSCYGYAAGATPDRNVSVLMANMVLRINAMRSERFYPFNSLDHLDLKSAASELQELFDTQARLLARRFTCHVSLTAGLDSRVTLAALRPVKDKVRTFSYITQPAHQIDADVAASIADYLGLDHSILTGDGADKDQLSDFAKILSKNNYHRHNVIAAYEYKSYFSTNSVHVRSNLFEIGRSFYRSQRKRDDKLDPRGMASLYYRGFSPAADQDLIAEFGGYVDRSNFNSALFNYDPFDIFYWEQRMSCWHAMVVLEADPAVETILLFNSRRCIELALGLELEQRMEGILFKEFIRRSWPELMEFPINPKQFVRAGK